MPVTNPVEYTYTSSTSSNSGSTATSIPHPPPVSKVEHVISGLKTITYGLAELKDSVQNVACLWMLHPRLQTQECMAPFAAQFIKSWNSRPQSSKKGLIAVSFDQRNHGSREVSSVANEAWRSGNEKHAQDMFSCYHGTSTDTSQLLDHLAAYIFPDSEDVRRIVQNIVFGISLGGHAAWHVMLQDPRFDAAVITIGCPDYMRLMYDRARLSKRKTWLDTQGKTFIGSSDFPTGLVEAVGKYDPASLVFGTIYQADASRVRLDTEKEFGASKDETVTELNKLLGKTLGNRRVINLSGGSDKLVPYSMGKPFLDWLKKITQGPSAPLKALNFHFEDVIIDGAGHEVPPQMVTHMERFLIETLEQQKIMDEGKIGSKI